MILSQQGDATMAEKREMTLSQCAKFDKDNGARNRLTG